MSIDVATCVYTVNSWLPDERRHLPAGTGLEFILEPVQEHFEDGHVVDTNIEQQSFVIAEPPLPAHPPLHEQPQFIQDLYEYWLDYAVDGPRGVETILYIETWYLEGGYVRHNDEQRPVALSEDYWDWERSLQQCWRDYFNPALDTDYIIVSPTPASSPTPHDVHLIISQQPRDFECASIVTTYDNGVLQGQAYTAALYLPSAVLKEQVIRDTGKTLFCPPP